MFTFADSFDFYTTVNDAFAGYWDSGSNAAVQLVAGRFAGSQALSTNGVSGVWLTKASGANDAVHHIVCSFKQSATLSGTNLDLYLQLSDATTNQVCIVFRTDGVILLTSATPGGTVLATYSGAVTAQNVWIAFEFEVIINNATGRFRARKNGNTTDDFDSGATLNTRPGTNAYANKLTIGANVPINNQIIDDLLWRSDPTSVAWMGDIRCYTRMPASDASVQFARSSSATVQTVLNSGSGPMTASTARYTPYTANYTGTVGSIVCNLNTGYTGNLKCAIFANNGGVPSTVLATATAAISNPVTGPNTFTFSPAVAVVKGTQYWVGWCPDTTVPTGWGGSSPNVGITATGPVYASWPSSSITGQTSGQNSNASSFTITPTINSEFVNEAQQDGTTSYVYDATVGHADLYAIGAASPAPTSVVAVTTRGFIEKSDAGSRSGAVQLKSGVTTAQSTSTPLSSSFTWLYRTDSTDPNTGSAWTPAAVDALQIGQVVTA